jgi:hypothetical protein
MYSLWHGFGFENHITQAANNTNYPEEVPMF